jgi:outer membrane protein assembly factor BamA
VKTGTPFDAAFGTNLRYEMPQTYAGSRLAQDAGRGAIVGTDRALLAGLAGGIILDTRDDEFVPTRGVYYQIGGAGTAGTAQHVAYGEAAAVLSSYFPVARFVTFAVRVMTSFELGRVPFYDLQQGGVFNQQYMIGADRGVRGVRLGRYAGRAKVLANYELRTTLIPRFRVLSWKVQVGTTTFFDAGRVWSGYAWSPLDGTSLGLHCGFGGGFFFQWEKSSVLRVEVAYSPENANAPGLPVSIYLANGLIF